MTEPVPRRAMLAAAALSAAFALWLYGRHAIDPSWAAWLLHGDPAQHFLGSVFFLAEPWHWPPGLITRFGDAPTSIVFTDAIPLVAFAAKLAGAAPGVQYFGLWMVACHVLAAVFGVRLLHAMGVRKRLALGAGGLFFAISPALLLRAYGHEALMAHFLVVAALELALRPWRWGPWLALVLVATWVHPYLALMVALVGSAAGMAAAVRHEVSLTRLTAQAAASLVLLAGAAWLAGYFVGAGQVSAGGHTFFSANALTWIDPMDWAAFLQVHQMPTPGAREWSRFLPAWPQATIGQYEGFAYLGAGALLLVLLALVVRVPAAGVAAPIPRARWTAVVAVCGLLALVALSAHPSIGSRVLWESPLPAWADRALGVFRSSGRFIWPATYLLLAWALGRVGRARWGAWVLVAALALQCADLAGKFREFRGRFRSGPPGIEQPVSDPLWPAVLGRCPRLEVVSGPGPARWTAAALAAGQAGARFAPAPTARLAPEAVQARQAKVMRLLAGQDWDPATVYLLAGPWPAGHDLESAVRALPSDFRHLRADGHDLAVPAACLQER